MPKPEICVKISVYITEFKEPCILFFYDDPDDYYYFLFIYLLDVFIYFYYPPLKEILSAKCLLRFSRHLHFMLWLCLGFQLVPISSEV